MISIIIGVILDFLIGDPYSFPHPVKLMGKIIAFEENIARKYFKAGLKFIGFIIVIINISLGFFIPFYILKFLKPFNIPYYILNIYLIYTAIAARSLHFEGNKIVQALNKGIDEGRKRLSYIVGRDTNSLNEEEIIKATVETISENTSDGVIAPLFFIIIFGAPGGMMYKFVNTMDSMLGYMDEKYKDIGYFPAKVDDIFNLIPARITSLLMIVSSIGKFNIKRGFRVLKRDRLNHKSPNGGYPESATAGLLGIKLGGNNYYNGMLVEKPSIGDKIKKVSHKDIDSTIEIMYRSEILFLLMYITLNIINLI